MQRTGDHPVPKVCTEQAFSLTQENNETLPICFKRQFFFFQHYLLPPSILLKPRCRMTAQVPGPRVSSPADSGTTWVMCSDSSPEMMLRLHSQHPQSSSQSFSPPPVPQFLPHTVTNPFVPTGPPSPHPYSSTIHLKHWAS